ncbi:MAG: hypothetical protein JO270_17050 [Acidobacteriaceae bacterium]|nr:hypothetical protein [Acidobacteriaceae bacterium]
MQEAPVSPLAGWVNFYVIIGSSSGALTGLQFVVMTLISELQKPGSMQEVRAFGTPTVVHFCAALLISAVITAPWPLSGLDISVGVCGVLGIAYGLRVLWHARNAAYRPDLEDWIWYSALPLVAYLVLAIAAILLRWYPIDAQFIIAAITLLLLYIGIHNAWDTVTYVALQRRHEADEK